MIYDSYYSKEDEMVTDCQRDLLTSNWGECFQQQFFLEKSKAEELNNICSCPNQEDIGQQTFHGNKEATNSSFWFYDLVTDYMRTLFGEHYRLFLEYATSLLFANFSWCMLILIFKFQQHGGIRSSTQKFA